VGDWGISGEEVLEIGLRFVEFVLNGVNEINGGLFNDLFCPG
jgi:hypothetical protein